ncbi:tryptophan-rich sensory protein [uncultured Pseudokineococcus sp.]|uniref:tryptophan-rich sensory protein n=1 Tax=uncultured Pseudokineococcus sp. TaxID=1642928 RepID=UPI00262A927E|nr:tryptophan-rich sensory protein [uncultured Pseudokineococcus sp.]
MERFAGGESRARATARDRTRQRVVLGSAVLALVVSTIGSGALGGTPIDEAADGTLSATATLVAPAGPAFSIWGVIYAGLVAYGVWQLVAARPADPRQRAVGGLLAASMLLNAAWIVVVQAGSVTLSVLVIVALVAVLGVVLARLARSAPSGWLEALLVDGVAGLYLGWVLIATVANVSAWLSGLGVGGLALGESAWAVVVLVVAAAIGAWLSLASGRVAPALSLGWGLAWVAVGRSSGEDTSGVVVVVAALAAVVVLAAGVTGRVRARRRRTAARPVLAR